MSRFAIKTPYLIVVLCLVTILVGIVSIGDVVKQRVEEIQGETETLRNYIEAR